MFRWRKRDEGFEWQKYVRTTIKLRREARRQKAQQLGAGLAEGARAAGVAADAMAREGAKKVGSGAGAAALRLGRLAMSGVSLAGLTLGALTKHAATPIAAAIDVLGRPGVAGPLTFIGIVAATAGGIRAALGPAGIDTEATVAFALGAIALILGLGPALWLGHAGLPRTMIAPVTGLPSRPWLVAVSVALLALVSAIGLRFSPWRPDLPILASLPPLPFTARTVTGRASVLAADTLRVGETTLRLTGLEPLDPDQRCNRSPARAQGRTWACGQDARESLQRLVQGKEIACEVGGQKQAGIVDGRCKVGGADIAEALVKAGHAFAEPGFASTYRTAEETARAAKAGLWAAPEPERPAAWRERMWSVAKRQAPDGCPIKGRVRGDERVYLLPWASDYERVRISKRRGERWFCSEEEAVTAGWRNARRS